MVRGRLVSGFCAATLAVVLVVLGACGPDEGRDPPAVPGSPLPAAPPAERAGSVRMFFAGDLMLGRRVAAVVANDPDSLFEDVRHTVSRADIALANLEAPFGHPERGAEVALVADSSAAGLVAAAGFDGLVLANNHAGDAGTHSVADTVELVEQFGMTPLGIVDAPDGVPQPVVVRSHGLKVALLAFDLTRQGPAPGLSAGVAWWEAEIAERLVRRAVTEADVVAVSLHGGVEHLPRPDAALRQAVQAAAGWGADVVWAHGAHLVYDVARIDPDGDGRSTVVAYGLGNFLFDQRQQGTEEGAVLEVIASSLGVDAYRVGIVEHDDLRVSAVAWVPPVDSAGAVAGEWWNIEPGTAEPESAPLDLPDRFDAIGDITAAGQGDVGGDGTEEIVVAFRRAFRPTVAYQRFGDRSWIDAAGRTAHLGVYDADDLSEEWVAGTLPRPVADLEICDTGIAVTYGELDAPGIVAGGAWMWREFGFVLAPDVAGPGTPACRDIDGNGTSDPVLLRDSS